MSAAQAKADHQPAQPLKTHFNGMLDSAHTTPGALAVNDEPLGIGADYNGSLAFQGNLANVPTHHV